MKGGAERASVGGRDDTRDCFDGDPSRFRLAVAIADPGGGNGVAAEVVALFERVAAAEGWKPDGELRAHVARSTYFGLWVADEGGRESLAGGLQLVAPDAAGRLPSHRVWPDLPVGDPAQAAHIAVLAVDGAWRGKAGGLFWRLTAAMWNHCVRSGVRELWLESTPRTARCYERFGWPLQARGDLREHWGEPCHPYSLSVREVGGALAERAVRSEAYRRVLADMVGSPAGTATPPG